jgi:hypothetical protein
MKWSYTASAFAWAALVCGAGGGCSKGGRGPSPAPDARDAGRAPGRSVAAAASSAPAERAPPVALPARRSDAGPSKLGLGKAVDVGPAGGVATASGAVLFRTKDDQLLFSADSRLDSAAITAPPAVTARSRAYWISKGKLVRRALAPAAGPIESLASDAEDGTRVAAHAAAGRDVVAYVARPASAKAERRARIWVEGAGADAPKTYDLSDEGAGASSVALAGAGARLWAVSLDERAAMSPLHARTIDLAQAGPPGIGPDVVVWVGPSCEVHTEIVLGAPGGEPVVIAPLARDATSFGLFAVPIGREPHMDSTPIFTPYPNGNDPAPVAVAEACAATWVAYVRPAAAAPDSPSVLAVAPLDGAAIGAEIVAAEASRILSVSLAGAALVFWADGRTFSRAIGCK